jgi:hypothetical protein
LNNINIHHDGQHSKATGLFPIQGTRPTSNHKRTKLPLPHQIAKVIECQRHVS